MTRVTHFLEFLFPQADGVGQSVTIVQGKTNVLSEAFIQSVVERVPATNSVGIVTGQTFRVKYQRALTE